FSLAEDTDDLFVGKTLLHGDVLMWLMKTLLTSWCINQRGAGQDYKTNSPCSFGKKIIINNLVTHNRWGYSLNWGWRRDQLADLERMLFLLDGKPIPDNRGDITTRLMEHVRDNPSQQSYEDGYFSIRYFKKGTGHLTFKHPELIDKMNDIIAKHYPGMLAGRN
ncbi:DUF4942 domain-containing protein, partial [Rahnella sp. C60]|uniref:DUF4942 domain-containing protein n=1 Tax=Rahnella perminowiae TaxID=2816244 RepID=UPI001C26CBD0